MAAYHNLHAVHSAAGDKATDTGATLIYVNAKAWGFMTFTIDADTISVTTKLVARDGTASDGDTFSYSAKPVVLADPKSVPTL